MDWIQIIILVAIILTSSILVIVGVQLIFILQDAKSSLRKLDNVLGDIEFMSHNLTRSSISIGHLIDSVKGTIELAGAATKVVSALTTKKPESK